MVGFGPNTRHWLLELHLTPLAESLPQMVHLETKMRRKSSLSRSTLLRNCY